MKQSGSSTNFRN